MNPNPDYNQRLATLLKEIRRGNHGTVRKFLEQGIDPNTMINGLPLLIHAVRDGYPLVTNILLAHGANPNCQASDKETPLHIAIKFSLSETIKILLYYHASIHLQDSKGLVPLELARTLSRKPWGHNGLRQLEIIIQLILDVQTSEYQQCRTVLVQRGLCADVIDLIEKYL